MSLKFGLNFLLLIALISGCRSQRADAHERRKMSTNISKDQTERIAIDRAKQYPGGLFSDPFKVLSFNPHPTPNESIKGAMYIYIIVDKNTGSVVSFESGGGS